MNEFTDKTAKAGGNGVVPVPVKTLERLVVYRILLDEMQGSGKTHIFSNELAQLAGNTAAQVRRDLMAVGYSGNTRHGYGIDDLRRAIGSLLEPEEGISMAVAGVGNLGRALLGYFSVLAPLFRIVACFDNDEAKVGRVIVGQPVFHVSELVDRLADAPPHLGVITVPPDQAQRLADAFVKSGVKGLVNFTPVPLHGPPGIWIETMHITAAFQKAAYFARALRAD